MRRRDGRRILAFQETLRRRVEAMYTIADNGMKSSPNLPNTDEIVNHIRSTYPDYHRARQQTLARFVEEALRCARNHHEQRNLFINKRKIIAQHEAKLPKNPPTPSNSAPESDGEISFDLTKTMLRNSYVEKNVALEVGKGTSMVNGKGEAQTKLKLARKQLNDNVNGSGSGGVEEEGKDVVRFRDLGGIKKVMEELNLLLLPIMHPEVARKLKVKPTSGVLFHGPPGCGKTTFVRAIANETGLPFYHISATEVVSGVTGASEQNIRDLFSKAQRTAPSIIFIDEIDAIACKRENLTQEMEKRMVTQFLSCMDQPHSESYVLVIGATNWPDAIDPAFRRSGRFDREIFIDRPDESCREEILSVLTRNVTFEGPIDLKKLAKSTPAFVASDLLSVINHSGYVAARRIVHERYTMAKLPDVWFKEPWLPEEVDKAAIKMSDLEEAVKIVQSSARREGLSVIPDVKWEDIGGLDLLRLEFEDYIIRPIKYPDDYVRFGVDLSTGFLLYGPPGCGKTLIAKAVANAAGVSFHHIKGPELLSKYVGESERLVRRLFNDARTCAPCILFFDEVDALTSKRDKESGQVAERVIGQLLVELDGADNRRGVFVIGATNRPGVIEPALLRHGRFGRLLYVPLPSPDQRVLILKALARKHPVDVSTDLDAIGRSEACENMSGADLAQLMVEAAVAAIEERTSTNITCDTIKPCHFEVALSRVCPSVSVKQRQHYQNLSETFGSSLRRNV